MQVSPPQFSAFENTHSLSGGARPMRSKCFLLMAAPLISGCAQVTDQVYSKKNFTSDSFAFDISECKRRNPSFVAIQSYVADSQERKHEQQQPQKKDQSDPPADYSRQDARGFWVRARDRR